jgi:hypothetical protein
MVPPRYRRLGCPPSPGSSGAIAGRHPVPGRIDVAASARTIVDMIRPFLALTTGLMLAATTQAQRVETVSIPGGHRIAVLVPPGYSYKVDRDSVNNAAVYMENPVWQISIKAYLITESDPAVTSGDWQRDHLMSRMADAFSEAKESDYNFKPLGPSKGTGTYCVLSDSKYKTGDTLPPGEYVYMTGGVKGWRGCYVYFQIMSNDLTTPEYAEALDLFRTSFEE